VCSPLEAYNTDALKKSSISEWNKMFKESRVKVIEIERSGCVERQRSDEKFEEVSNVFAQTNVCLHDRWRKNFHPHKRRDKF
jgi:hypothetical protein